MRAFCGGAPADPPGRRLAVITIVASLAVPQDAWAQESCNNIASGGGQSVAGFFKANDNSCTVAENTYVVTSFQYRLDALSTADGQCTLRGWDCSPLPCQCVTTAVEQRGVYHTLLQHMLGGPSPPYSINALKPLPLNSYPHITDSRVAGATTPEGATWTPLNAGEETVRFKNIIRPTSCGMSPTEVLYEFPVFVVKCAPKFLTPGSGGTLPRHLPAGPVEIYFNNVSAAVITAMGTAADDWEAVQGQTWFVPALGPCNPSNPSCITVQETEPNFCAVETIPPAGSDSVFTESPVVNFKVGSSAYGANALRRTANHELGHLLGLDELYSSCSQSKGLMGTVASCNGVSGFAYTPQHTEILPVTKSVQGPYSTASCPAAP